ncbi:TIM barrel protein [Microbacterium sp.]|uniref:sugar phosphate isomerase/epimerase and 4-hydroxyphenylpyruvate domain-containing protein n=1 Tax=Microbacterium sp. TaxID=51671 RepID=UPI003A8896A1
MKRVLATVSLSGTLRGKLEAAAAAGFDGVEIAEGDLAASPLRAEDVAALVADLGMTVEMYQPLRDVEGVADEALPAVLARIDRALDLTGRLGGTRLQIASNVETAVSGDIARTADQLRLVAEAAADRRMTVAWEPIAWARYLRLHAQGRDVVAAVDHPALGLCLDLFHFAAGGEDAAVLRSIPASRIEYVQLNDLPRMDGDLLAISRVHRLLPGQGDADVDGYVRELRATGYDGPVSIEAFDERARLGTPERVARVAALSLETVFRDASRAAAVPIAGVARVEVPPATVAALRAIGVATDAVVAGGTDRIGRVGWAAGGAEAGVSVARGRELAALSPVTAEVVEEAADPGILTVTLATDQIDEPVLYARRALGLSVERGAQVAGARSPMRPLLARDGDAVRLRIDHADAGVGPAVDGITLVVDDLDAVAARAREAGLSLVVPAGYYDTLRVRNALSDDLLDALEWARLTIDVDGGGVRRLTVPTPGVIIELVDRVVAGPVAEVDAATLRHVRNTP